MYVKDGIVTVDEKMVKNWAPAMEHFLGKAAVEKMSETRRKLLTGMAATKYAEITGCQIGVEADMAIMTSDNTSLAPDVVNPVATGTGIKGTSTKGSGDKQFYIGLCIAIAAKTIGLDLVQTVPASSQNVTIKYLNVVYNGGDVNNAANDTIKVITLELALATSVSLVSGQKYIVYTEDSGTITAIELTYVKPDRKGAGFYVFTVGHAFTATLAGTTVSNITYLTAGPAVGALAATGKLASINAAMDTITAVVNTIASCANTQAVENYIPHQTTKGFARTLTRSEADAGTDHQIELELESEAHTIGNRVFVGNISRLKYKQLQESGVDATKYLAAAMKNEVSQEINFDIVSACRAFGLTNALAYEAAGSSFNTYVGPAAVASVPFANLPYADQLKDADGNPVAAKFAAIPNIMATMQFETIASVGTYLCMLISQAAFAIGTDSRFGEGDSVVLASGLAGYLAACSQFTKLSDKDVDMTSATGAKLSGYINGIKVYVDVQAPQNSPYVTVLRSNQDVKVDAPGIDDDNILVPGIAYLVKDLVSSVELVPSGTGGIKTIMDSETDIVKVGNTAEKAYITFAFCVSLPGMVGAVSTL